MKNCVLIIDGAAGWRLPEQGNHTCLELARTPNLDALAEGGMAGLARTVPEGMEPGSACACMSVIGYDPRLYYRGRAGIEARSMGITVAADEVVFRCNLVAVREGKMSSYSAGHISTEEARVLIEALDKSLGNERIKFYPGVSYRHILKLKGYPDTLRATCTPPHDIPDRLVKDYLPGGTGSELLRDLMARSEAVLREHPVNKRRQARGGIPATAIWLFWGTGHIPQMPPFQKVYGLGAAMTSGVDLLRGLALMAGMDILQIPGVTDGPDNDYAAQVNGALKSLESHDLVVIHVEAPDEAAHAGSVEAKVAAIEKIDELVVGRLRARRDDLKMLIMPDHPTPIKIRTHVPDPVPFLLWGRGFRANGAKRFTEAEARKTGIFLEDGYNIMGKLVGMQILNNASIKIKKFDAQPQPGIASYLGLLSTAVAAGTLIDSFGNPNVSAEYIDAALRGYFKMNRGNRMGNSAQFIAKLNVTLKTLKTPLLKLRPISITDPNLVNYKADIQALYDAFSNAKHGLSADGTYFCVGATKVMHLLFPHLCVMLDSIVGKKVLGCSPGQQNNFSAYWNAMLTCRSELSAWQNIHGNLNGLLKLDAQPTTLTRIFDKCAMMS